jgi:hypothetical protein
MIIENLAPWNRLYLEKVIFVQQGKNYLHLVEPRGSLPYSLAVATGPFTESNESSPLGFR